MSKKHLTSYVNAPLVKFFLLIFLIVPIFRRVSDENLPLFQFCTFLGSCLVPFSCLTVWELTKSTTAAGIAGALILFGKLF